ALYQLSYRSEYIKNRQSFFFGRPAKQDQRVNGVKNLSRAGLKKRSGRVRVVHAKTSGNRSAMSQ
ncbi:MAG: hypothetical protein MUQ48_05195, partial [Pirellulales bacterium]|nr:hypothetical protein [Pirellulales bacterium]